MRFPCNAFVRNQNISKIPTKKYYEPNIEWQFNTCNEKIKQIVNIRLYMYNMRFIVISILGCLFQALCFFTLPLLIYGNILNWKPQTSRLDIFREGRHICWQLKSRWNNIMKLLNCAQYVDCDNQSSSADSERDNFGKCIAFLSNLPSFQSLSHLTWTSSSTLLTTTWWILTYNKLGTINEPTWSLTSSKKAGVKLMTTIASCFEKLEYHIVFVDIVFETPFDVFSKEWGSL